MVEDSVPVGYPVFIVVFGLGHQIEAIDIDLGTTYQLAYGAADAQIDAAIHWGDISAPEPLATGPGLFRSRKPIGYPQDRAVLHAGGAADTRIGLVLDLGLFLRQ